MGQSDGSGKRAPRIEAQIQEIDSGLSALMQSAGGLIHLIDPYTGEHIKLNSGQFVRAVCRAARQDAKLRGWCLELIHASGYTEIISAAIILILPPLIYHGIIPARFFSSLATDDNDPSN